MQRSDWDIVWCVMFYFCVSLSDDAVVVFCALFSDGTIQRCFGCVQRFDAPFAFGTFFQFCRFVSFRCSKREAKQNIKHSFAWNLIIYTLCPSIYYMYVSLSACLYILLSSHLYILFVCQYLYVYGSLSAGMSSIYYMSVCPYVYLRPSANPAGPFWSVVGDRWQEVGGFGRLFHFGFHRFTRQNACMVMVADGCVRNPGLQDRMCVWFWLFKVDDG